MPTGTVSFRGDLNKFAAEIKAGVAQVQKKIVFDLHAEVTALTPVDTGRLRAAWMVGVGAPNDTVPPEIDQQTLDAREKDKKDGKTVEAIIAAPEPPDLSGIDGTTPVFITNSLVYAEPIEDGHSKQRPNGMLKVAVATIEAKFIAAGGALFLDGSSAPA